MGFAIVLFHHVYKIFLIWPILSSILMHQKRLAIDPLPYHSTVSTQLHCRPFFARVDECIRGPREFRSIERECIELCCVFERMIFSFTHPVFLCRPIPKPIYPRRILDCATPTYVSNSCGCTGLFSHLMLAWTTPFRTSPSDNMLQNIDHRIGSVVTDPSHCSPHAVGNHLMQKKKRPIFTHIFLAVLQILA